MLTNANSKDSFTISGGCVLFFQPPLTAGASSGEFKSQIHLFISCTERGKQCFSCLLRLPSKRSRCFSCCAGGHLVTFGTVSQQAKSPSLDTRRYAGEWTSEGTVTSGFFKNSFTKAIIYAFLLKKSFSCSLSNTIYSLSCAHNSFSVSLMKKEPWKMKREDKKKFKHRPVHDYLRKNSDFHCNHIAYWF